MPYRLKQHAEGHLIQYVTEFETLVDHHGKVFVRIDQEDGWLPRDRLYETEDKAIMAAQAIVSNS